MNFFYNNKGVGDVLIVTLKDRCKGERLVERKNAVARIYDGKNNKTVGFNFFDASKSLNLKNKKGSFTPEDSMIDDLNHLLENEGYKDRLSYSEQPAFVIADVKEKEKHPDADKLSVCQVDVGNDSLQIVCGAPNVEANQKVVVARVGAVMPSGMVIRDAKLRGVPSTGMICSAKELGLANPSDQKGILVLDTKESAGTDFFDTVNH